jgi:spore coat polysaccharide biosynthesis predicted glycosyltransferase SpsG
MNVSDMYTELGGADLFLGSGGTITWERAFCGLPSVVISVAENQVEINKALCNDNIINYLGYCNDVNINQIRAELEKMNSHKELRQQLSKNSLKLKVSSKVDQIIDYLIKDL